MKAFIYCLLTVITFTFSACNNQEVLYIYPKDKSQCITVITYKYDKIRYIISGKHLIPPDVSYVKIDIGNIDPLADGIWGCWKKGGWELAVEGAIIIKNKLDTTKFKFKNRLPRDKWNIPRETKYRKKNCFVFSFYSKGISPKSGDATVEW